jgi:hypothetical protein
MTKYKFTNAQRFAIWKHHGQTCYWCGEPLRLQETTVDHVVPEHLLDKPDELERLRTLFGLSSAFVINDYCNWLPAHDKCNKNKSGKTLPLTPLVQTILDKLRRDAEEVRRIEQRVKADAKKDKLLGHVMVALEEDDIKKEDILNLFADPELPQDEDVQVLRREIHLRVDPNRWHVASLNNDIAVVTDGKRGGITPVGTDTHWSWECPHCGSFGPWNGAICLTCMRRSMPDD